MYLLQSILISGGFLAVYHIFLKRETLFKENRLFLLSGLVLTFLFPLIKIKRNIVLDRPIFTEAGEQLSQVAQTASESVWYSPENILLTLYIGVCIFLMVRFILKLASLKKLAQNAYRRRERPFLHMETEKKISPFSFFNYIFYNPSLFEPNGLPSNFPEFQKEVCIEYDLSLECLHFFLEIHAYDTKCCGNREFEYRKTCNSVSNWQFLIATKWEYHITLASN